MRKKPRILVEELYSPPPGQAVLRGKVATFQSSMKATLLVGQCFGLNPVVGIANPDVYRLRFKMCSLRGIYCLLSTVGQACLLCMNALNLFMSEKIESVFENKVLVFDFCNWLTTILFIRVAVRWPALCQHIARIEATSPNLDPSLPRKCNVACAVMFILALVEHILSNAGSIALAIDCQPGLSPYEAFSTASGRNWLYERYGFQPALAFFLQFFNLQCTFNWNYCNVFVICVSLYLISRFEQINQRLAAVRGKNVPAMFWRGAREEYNRTARLVKMVDDVIAGIIFISFSSNMFFICLQLLHTLQGGIKAMPPCGNGPDYIDKRPLKGYEQLIYFVFSLLFLLARSLAVCLICARVNSVSTQPAHVLYEVPNDSYCSEVKRFLQQIHEDSVALTGLKFFKIKKGLVLTVVGTVVTYELVLLQFAGPSSSSAHHQQR